MRKKLKRETLREIVDFYSAGASYNQAAKMVGISARTLWGWIAKSRASDDPELMLEMYGEIVSLERALVMGRRAIALEARSKFEAAVLKQTRPVVQTFQGRVCWTEDPRTVGWTPDERENFGFDRDGLIRNEKGETIPLTIETYVPIAATIKFLSTHFSEYEDHQNIRSQITMNRPTQGATTPPRQVGPPVVPPRPPLPQIEVLPEPVVASDPGPDLSEASGLALEEMLGDEPEQPVEQPDPPVSSVKQDTGPMIAVPTPEAYQPTPTTRPISPTLAGLLRRGST